MIKFVFYFFEVIAVITSLRSIIHVNPVRALLCLIVFLFSIAGIFVLFGVYLLSALEIIIYAGAIMVLFIFVVMTLNMEKLGIEREYQLFKSEVWNYPIFLSIIMFLVIAYPIFGINDQGIGEHLMSVKAVGMALFGSYVLAVELASILLLAGLISAFQISYEECFSNILDIKVDLPIDKDKKDKGVK